MLKKVPYRETDLQTVYAKLEILNEELVRLEEEKEEEEEEEEEEEDENEEENPKSSSINASQDEDDDVTIEQRSIACQVSWIIILVVYKKKKPVEEGKNLALSGLEFQIHPFAPFLFQITLTPQKVTSRAPISDNDLFAIPRPPLRCAKTTTKTSTASASTNTTTFRFPPPPPSFFPPSVAPFPGKLKRVQGVFWEEVT